MQRYSLAQKTKTKSQTLPRLKSTHNFLIRFFPIWIVLFGASWGASYGWRQYMDECCGGSVGKHSYTFIAWVISFCLFLWTLIAIYNKLLRFRMLFNIINVYMRLVDELFYNSIDVIVNKETTLDFYWEQTKKEYRIEYYKVFSELLLGVAASLILFLYETMCISSLSGADTLSTLSKDDAFSIVKFISELQQSIDFRTISEIFYMESNNVTFAAGDSSYSVLMLSVLTIRIQQMAAMFSANSSALTSLIFKLKEDIDNYREYPVDFANETWIMWPIMFIGLVFPFLIPPVFYSTMGSDIFYIGPVIFFFIGSPVIINIVLGDPIRWPSNLHMQLVYNKIVLFGQKIESKFSDKFMALFKQLNYDLTKLANDARASDITTQQQALIEYNRVLTKRDKLQAELKSLDYLSQSVVAFLPNNFLLNNNNANKFD